MAKICKIANKFSKYTWCRKNQSTSCNEPVFAVKTFSRILEVPLHGFRLINITSIQRTTKLRLKFNLWAGISCTGDGPYVVRNQVLLKYLKSVF